MWLICQRLGSGNKTFVGRYLCRSRHVKDTATNTCGYIHTNSKEVIKAGSTLSTLVKLRSDVLETLSMPTPVLPPQARVLLDDSLRKLISDRLRRRVSHLGGENLHGCRLERLEWDRSDPVDDLEVLLRGEKVHPMDSLDMLQKRFRENMRVFVLKHDELYGGKRPLLAAYVSLSHCIPSSMADIAGNQTNDTPSVATFYSINNMELGLKGIELGQGMIHGIVELLKKEFPSSLKTCVTLSPVPLFRSWVQSVSNDIEPSWEVFEGMDVGILKDMMYGFGAQSILDEEGSLLSAALLALEKTKYDPVLYAMLEKPLVRLCRIYMERKIDPVERFHVENGASLYRINHSADLSWQGTRNSYGLMANYWYPI